ncbi:hypothetical protein HYFRA_00007174 [Hymenoscyphus fraxineus]|uniref:Uncharacterized protein n=1 Tax=Hymenoscyphus fraxineus TaxID=746836 RepID=A0A9N9KYL5_9HELO|nr:hypothetical protein HYFRA_00007174 [Hymenoscyphus fraxineus]
MELNPNTRTSSRGLASSNGHEKNLEKPDSQDVLEFAPNRSTELFGFDPLFDKTLNNFSGALPHLNLQSPEVHPENVAVLNDRWANTIDCDELSLAFQKFENGVGGESSDVSAYSSISSNDTPSSRISDMSAYSTITPNDTPASSKYEGPDPTLYSYDGVNLDMGGNFFDREWMQLTSIAGTVEKPPTYPFDEIYELDPWNQFQTTVLGGLSQRVTNIGNISRGNYVAQHQTPMQSRGITSCKSQPFLREQDRVENENKMHSGQELTLVSGRDQNFALNRHSDVEADRKTTNHQEYCLVDENEEIYRSKDETTPPVSESQPKMHFQLGVVEQGERQSSLASQISHTDNDSSVPTERQESALADSDCSAGFETDSTWSEDCSDGAEDEIDITAVYEHLQQFKSSFYQSSTPGIEDSSQQVQLLLSPMRRQIVDRIMKEFWIIFNQEWSASFQKHSGGSPQSTSSSVSQHNSKAKKQSGHQQGKRCREDENNEDPEEDEGRDSKRPRLDLSPHKAPENHLKFACPYRKHNPRTYCHRFRRWRCCALSPLDTIARVKGHLYRYHRISQCPRCKTLHAGPDDLEQHTLAVKSCELNHEPPAEGITDSIEKKLKSRKKAHRAQSQAERWQELYRILFPGEEVPSPYYETTRDDIICSPESEELASYEEYSRRELPRFFQSALETAIATEAQPIEERLRSQLVGMIQDCQDRVFATYKANRSVNTSMSNSQSPLHVDDNDGNSQSGRTGIIKSLYERAPSQTSNGFHPEPALTTNFSSENAPSDSGYFSERLPPNSESTKTTDVLTSDSVIADSQQNQHSSDATQGVHTSSEEMITALYFPIEEVSLQQMNGYEFQDMPSFKIDQPFSFDEVFDGFNVDDFMPLNDELVQENTDRELFS